MQKKSELRLTENEIEYLISVLSEKEKEAGDNGDICKACEINMIARKIQSAVKFEN